MENFSEEDLIKKLRRRGVLTSTKKCSKCSSELKLTTRKRNKESRPVFTLRCANPKCQSFQSVLFITLINKYNLFYLINL